MSGAATNAGIEYQQRVASLFFLAAAAEWQWFPNLGLEQSGAGFISKISFETDAPVDDLNVFYETAQLYLQIKRSVVFSNKRNSPFIKSLQQFAKQHLINPDAHLILITSSLASDRVTLSLSKALYLGRTAENAENIFRQNRQIQLAYDDFKIIASKVLQQEAGADKDIDIEKFLKQIYVVKVDIEPLDHFEQAVFLRIKSLDDNTSPLLIWNSILTKCLESARGRLTLTANECRKYFSYVVELSKAKTVDALENFFPSQLREVLVPARKS